jgi:NADPH:quinone reductase-like Zn-dependent oxidoreductase
MTTKLWLLLAIPVLLRLLKSKTLPSRETIIRPTEERVLLLGASSGVGRDLAHVYAKRGARMYVYLSYLLTIELD